jgi:hypothetical protein
MACTWSWIQLVTAAALAVPMVVVAYLAWWVGALECRDALFCRFYNPRANLAQWPLPTRPSWCLVLPVLVVLGISWGVLLVLEVWR